MRSGMLILWVLLLVAGVSAQEALAECAAGNDDATGLLGHRVMFGHVQNGAIDNRNAELIIEQASVPDGVVGADGGLWVYYVNGVPGAHGIHISTLQDDGTWDVLDCVKLDGEFNGNAVDPDLVRLDDGRYRLYYFLGTFVGPRPEPPPPADELHPIYSAISEDGINFTVESIVFEYPRITDPTVVQTPDGTWVMAAAYNGQMVIASGADGLSFTEVTIVDDRSIPELSLDADGSVLLWGQAQWRSVDNGQTWTQTTARSFGPDPSLVTLADGSQVFFYKTFDPEMQPNRPPVNNEQLPVCEPPSPEVTPQPCRPRGN